MANAVQYILSLKDMLTPEIERADAATSRLEKNLMHVGETVAAAFAIHKIVEFGKEILHTTAEFEGFGNIIKYASIDQADGAENINYLTDAVKRLHLPMREAYEQFSELEGGMYGTGVEGKKLRDVFEGIATASSTLHLNADQFSRGAYAIKEIGELGTLQARQMRMLAMAIPGSMKIAADALGISTEKLHERMGEGLIKAGDFLPKFAAKMKSHFESGLANAGNSLISKMNDTQSEFIRLQLKMGEDLRPVYISIMQGIIEMVDKLKEGWEWMVAHKDGIYSLVKALEVIIGTYITYKAIILAQVAATKLAIIWEGIQYISITRLGDGFFKANAMQKLLSAGLVQLQAVIMANPFAFAVAAIIGLTATVFSLANSFGTAAKKNQELNKSLSETIALSTTQAESWVTGVVYKYQNGYKLIDAAGKGIRYSLKEQNDGIKKELGAMIESIQDSGDLSWGSLNQINTLRNWQTVMNKVKGKNNIPTNNDTTIIDKGSKATGSKNIRIDVKIGNLIGSYTSSVTNIKEMTANIKEHVTAALVGSVNDFQIVAGE